MSFLRINGFDTSSLSGCQVVDIGSVEVAQPRRVTSVVIHGANGRLDVTDGAYNGYETTLRFVLARFEDIPSLVGAFRLEGNELEMWFQLGSVRFCDYIGSSYKPFGLHYWEVEVKVYMQPFRYMKGVPDVVLANSGSITNTGTVFSEPVIVIEGSGPVTLTMGKQTMHLQLDGRATIDCRHRRQAVYDKNGAVKNSIRKKGPFFELPVGMTGISTTGAVTRLLIKGNWRYLV